MTLSTTDDFPESSLAGEYNRSTRGQSQGRPLLGRQQNNYRNNRDGRQDVISSTSHEQINQGSDTPAHLAATLTRQPVDVDRPSSALHYIGKANSGPQWRTRVGNIEEKGGEPGATRWAPPQPSPTDYPNPGYVTTANVQRESAVDSHGREPRTTEDSSTTRGRDRFVPHQEPTEAHPQQFRPNQAMYTLATTLFKRDPMEWKIDDIKTPYSSDGVAVLNSAFVDHAVTTLYEEMTMSQRYQLAQQITVTAPETTLEFLYDSRKARSFISWALDKETKLPPVLEKSLCPLITPRLITNEIVRTRMLDNSLLRSEQQEIINTFIECFYPKSKAGVQGLLTTLDTSTLHKYIHQAGEIARDMRVRRRTMAFSPPKWYRLSIQPGTKITTTPRRQVLEEAEVTWQSLPISRADMRLKMGSTMDTLMKQPILLIKTTILSAIPKIFEDRQSQEGMTDTLKLFSEASQEEILHFLDGSPPPSAQKGVSTEPLDRGDDTGYRHHLRLEHMERRRKGKWDIPAPEVLLQWLHVIQPVLSVNDISLAIVNSIFSRERFEQYIMGRIKPEMATALNKYIYIIEGDKRLSRFDIWVKSSCKNLVELLDESRYGSSATGYKKGMKSAKIWVEVISTSPGDVVPVLVMGGNLETDSNSITVLELNDRLEKSGVDLRTCPPFHIESVTVTTSEGRDTMWTKCVMANRGSATTLQEKFARIPTPGSRARYLVTRDYHFVPLSYPPTDTSDRVLKSAMHRHRTFMASTTKTAISGFKDIDPFYETPKSIHLAMGVTRGNTKTIAEIILLDKYRDQEGIMTDSPVIRVTTNKGKTKLYLTALSVNAESLIWYTDDLLKTIEPWFTDRGQHIQCDVNEARRYLETLKVDDQTPTNQTQDAETTIDTSRDTGTSREVSQEGISVRDDIQNLKQLVVVQQAQITEIHSLVRLVLNKIEETKPLRPDDMIGTIMTMVETNLQSSLSSSSAMAMSQCTTRMEEQKHTIMEHLSETSRQMTTLCTTVTESDKRQDIVFTEAKQIAQTMKEGHDNLAELIQATAGSARQMMETFNATQPTEHTTMGQCNPHGKGETNSLWPPRPGATSSWPPSIDHDAIRTRAIGVLNLMESLPHTPPTWLEKPAKDLMGHPQRTEEITINSRESICAKCKKQDIGLLFCDRCPEEVLTLYHPNCLTRIDETADRVCEYCWEASQAQDANLDESTTTSTLKGVEDTTQSTPQELLVNTATSESSDSSRGSSSESDYNPKFRPSPKGRQQLSREEPTPQIKYKHVDTRKISPLQTRAARKAVKKARDDAFDTSDEGENK